MSLCASIYYLSYQCSPCIEGIEGVLSMENSQALVTRTANTVQGIQAGVNFLDPEQRTPVFNAVMGGWIFAVLLPYEV